MSLSDADTEVLSGADTKAGRIQRALLELLRQHEADGALPTNGRFLFYELVQLGVIPKAYKYEVGDKVKGKVLEEGDPRIGTLKPWQPSGDVSAALTHLREEGLIPWNWIVDETRTMHAWEFAGSGVCAESASPCPHRPMGRRRGTVGNL
jgi:hypothetical protein